MGSPFFSPSFLIGVMPADPAAPGSLFFTGFPSWLISTKRSGSTWKKRHLSCVEHIQSSRMRSSRCKRDLRIAIVSLNWFSISAMLQWSRRVRFTRTKIIQASLTITRSAAYSFSRKTGNTSPLFCASGRATSIAFCGRRPLVIAAHPFGP